LHLKHYKNAQIIITDDLIAYGKQEEEMLELLDYALKNGISMRDDSPMVKGYIENDLDTWTVRSPQVFKAAYLTMPTIFELEHYGKVKENGYWLGKNGEGIIPGINVSGVQIFRNAMKLIHPTYIGFHGYLGEWLNDNPDLTKELLNLCGYWYFPKTISSTKYKNGELSFEIEWLNKGVAPAYSIFQLKGKLMPVDTSKESIEFVIEDAGNIKWLTDQISLENYKVSIPGNPIGEYQFAIQLYDKKSEMPVDLGLSTGIKNDDYFILQNLFF